jgi:O-antigen ligase
MSVLMSALAPRPALGPPPSGASILLALVLGLIFSGGWQIFVLGPDAPPGDSPVARALYLPAYAAALCLLAPRAKRALAIARRAPLIGCFVAFSVLSSLWSIDPSLTLRRSAALAATTLSGLALACVFDWIALTEILAAVFGLLALASLALALARPDLGRMTQIFPGAWRGVWNEKNALGLHMGLAVLLSLAAARAAPRRRLFWLLCAGLAVALVGLSTSKTALIALLGGLVAWSVVGGVRKGLAFAVAAAFLIVSAAAAGALVLTFQSDWVFGLLGKDATLTGRLGVWSPVIRQAAARPWLGYGYGAVWDDQSRWGPLAWIVKEATFRPREAHDAWLGIWIEVGALGLGLWMLAFLAIWRRALARILDPQSAFVAAPLLTFLTLAGFTENTPVQYNDLVWVLFSALAFRLGQPAGDAPKTPVMLKAAPEAAARSQDLKPSLRA